MATGTVDMIEHKRAVRTAYCDKDTERLNHLLSVSVAHYTALHPQLAHMHVVLADPRLSTTDKRTLTDYMSVLQRVGSWTRWEVQLVLSIIARYTENEKR